MGSLALPENLREVLTQLDTEDLLVFFDAFKINVPLQMAQSSSSVVPFKTLLIEILVKECSVT